MFPIKAQPICPGVALSKTSELPAQRTFTTKDDDDQRHPQAAAHDNGHALNRGISDIFYPFFYAESPSPQAATMGKKRRNHPNLEELLDRAWCYYCERDFEDLKLLISHQKAKHFKCERCGRRLNTAGGLSVHMNQVHKETLSHVENALEGREGLDVEIFGMEGIPEDALFQHNQQITEDYHKHRADRQAATGNPPPGQPGSQGAPRKKFKMETPEELKARLRVYIAQRKAEAEAAAAAPQQQAPPLQPPTAPAAAAAANGGGYSQDYPGSLPTRPPNGGAAVIPGGLLPQRPPAYGASTLDDLVSGAAAGGPPPAGDDIDKIIRMAEAGIRPGAPPPADGPAAGSAPAEKEKSSSKKDKSMRMVYQDGDFSLEEKMAQMPRYAVHG